MYQSLLTAILVFLLELRYALAAPTGAGKQQVAITEDSQPSTPFSSVHDTTTTIVGIAFQSTSLSSNNYVEVPLGKRVSLRDLPSLPRRPTRGRIVGTYVNPTTGPHPHRSLDAFLDKTVCMAFPKPRDTSEDIWLWGRSKDHGADSPSGKALLEKGRARAPAAPVWWKLRDGWVDFNSSSERWWLKGREIEALQCI